MEWCKRRHPTWDARWCKAQLVKYMTTHYGQNNLALPKVSQCVNSRRKTRRENKRFHRNFLQTYWGLDDDDEDMGVNFGLLDVKVLFRPFGYLGCPIKDVLCYFAFFNLTLVVHLGILTNKDKKSGLVPSCSFVPNPSTGLLHPSK